MGAHHWSGPWTGCISADDKESGIINDPNAWFADNPAGLVSHLRRLVQVSVETTRIVAGLPPALAD